MVISRSILTMIIRIKKWRADSTKSLRRRQNCFRQGRVKMEQSTNQLKGRECKQSRWSLILALVPQWICLSSREITQSRPWVQKFQLLAFHTPRSWSGTLRKRTMGTSIDTSLLVADTSTTWLLSITSRRMTLRSRVSTISRFGCTCVMVPRFRHVTRTPMLDASSTSCASMSS